MTSALRLASRPSVADQPWAQPRIVVTSMTANQPTPRPRAWQAVGRAARALKSINDQQVSMWEAFWRTNRFPAD
jgi:hypothetical protein